jgi:diguanylate cyclase (GGDEF)-like protein
VGGEEFVILFPNTTLKISTEIGEKLLKLVETNLNTISDKTITISMGISEMLKGDTEDSLYRRVDKLLYVSKHNGKNMISSLM